MSPVAVTISLGGSSWTGGTVGVSFGIAEWLRVRRMAWRRAADRSLGSGWSLDWTSMTKAELTAENRPAYEKGSENKNQRGVEVLIILLDVV